MKKILLSLTLTMLFPLLLSSFNINGNVWNDKNQNWEKNANEQGYPNAKIELYTGNNTKINDTLADTDGNYQFNNLAVGEYTVKVIKPNDGIIITSSSIELWLEINRTDINFGLLRTTIINQKDFILYEDAEDNKTDGWVVPQNGNLTNTLEQTKNTRVINLQSTELYANEYQFNLNNNTNNFNITWEMKTTEGFIVDILINTTLGERFLRYNDGNINGKDNDVLFYGLGYTPTNGTWNTIIRDLNKDVKNLEVNNQLLSIQSFNIRANAKLDNIELYSSPIKIYEDAEDGQVNRWSIYGGDNTANISNITDATLNSKVISLQGNSYAHRYIIGGDYIGEANAWNDKKNTNIQWSMKNNDGFVTSLVINTNNGVRYINYYNIDKNYSAIEGDTLNYGLGENASNGEWHTYIRDIKADLLRLEPNNKLLSVEGFIAIGSMSIDNLELFHVLHPTDTQAGISLTFDDTTISSWFNLRNMFSKYNAKATFFVSHFFSLDNIQINQLKALEADGSEIGCHTYNHKGVTQDFNNDVTRITEYIEEQIKTPYDQMISAGFTPTSFAYPYGEHHPAFDEAVRAYFPYIRLTFDDFQNDLSTQASIYHSKKSKYSLLSGAGIDKDFNNSTDEILKALVKARKHGEIITFYAHDVINDPNKQYNITPQKLEKVIENAQNLGLKFYTHKEAYQVGNQN